MQSTSLLSPHLNMTFPPQSIAINTKEIVDACELMELSLPPPPDSIQAETRLRYTKVTQMAGLLYLHEYQHARHLWRRQSSNTTNNNSEDPEFYQLKLLWSAAKHMMNNNPTSAFVGLNMCMKSNLQPLANHAKEVMEKYREDMVVLMERSYLKISWMDCCEKLGVKNEDSGGEELRAFLGKRGWDVGGNDGVSSEYISPPKGGYAPEEEEDEDDSEMEVAEDKKKRDDKIQELTEIVAFMECRRTNA